MEFEMYQPLEQFEQYVVFGVYFKYINIGLISNIALVSGLVSSLSFFLSFSFLTVSYLNQNNFLKLIIQIFLYLTMVFKTNTRLNNYTRSSFCWLFIFVYSILIQNCCGLIPYFFCNTSQLIITLCYSSSIIIGITISGIILYKKQFIYLFIPQNIPLILKPLLFCLEIISYISRILSLAIRLFANMLAGHASLHILTNVTWLSWSMNTRVVISDLLIIIPLILISLIFCLETIIAGSQTYVFFTLGSIYSNDLFLFDNH